MSRKPVAALPDVDADEAFRQTMQPLLSSALPKDRRSGLPVERKTGRAGAAQEAERIEAARGDKRRYEFVLPTRVGRALAEDAAKRGVSATTRLLEVLRSTGYPVIPEDLIDLRRLPKR